MALPDDIRAARNQKLDDCDWVQMSDYPYNPAKSGAWVIYRQALRDVPQNQDLDSMTDISQVVWPTPPV